MRAEVPSAFSDFIKTDVITRQTCNQQAKGKWSYQPLSMTFRRAGCLETGPSRSREAFERNPRSPSESNLQILSHAVVQLWEVRASGKNLRENSPQAVMFKAGEKLLRASNPASGTKTKAICGPIRVRGSLGLCNAAGVGSLTVVTRINRR